MDELILIGILVALGALFLVSYVIVFNSRKILRFEKVNEQEIELIRAEKELDRTESITRGLHLYKEIKRKIR